MMTMMQNMSERLIQKQTDKVKITDIFLPSFDPDGNVGVREWCDHISTAVSTYQLSDYDIRMKVNSLLKGRARVWADNWLVTTSTWAELRDVIITTFEPENRYSRDILKFREHSYNPNKNIAEFLSQGWLLWKRITRDKLDNNDAVEAVIGMISDERLRIELMNVRVKTVPELISVASSIRSKRPSQTNENLVPQKRARFSLDRRSSPYCNFCHKVGHTSQNCRYKSEKNASSVVAAVGSTTSTSTNKVCFFCSKPGHTFDTCYRREKQITYNVNTVTSNNSSLNTMRMKVDDIEIYAGFDSGAECSVMRETYANKIPGRRHQVVNYLRGLGPVPVISTSTLTTICSIDNINVEIEFHILPDFEMTTNVLIGANLLRNTGLSVVVTQTHATLTRNARVFHIHSNSPLFDNLNHDLTDQSQIDQLLRLLNKYSYLFTRGFSQTRVNTGELEIRLKNPDKFVERRPYRLTPIERQKVKDIVSELIANNIIRESKSPYFSPIVLVKKKNGDDRMCVDYRELNSNTIRDHYPLPLIGDQIDQLVGGRYFNCLDMASGFHQIPISAGSIEKVILWSYTPTPAVWGSEQYLCRSSTAGNMSLPTLVCGLLK
ncbi:unnamed protein product [Euphydryas editha]|uniref:Reverse transcriptase domain-containing protein n=1 Tax=Euphydryas editha TaxID=104508 RepID=A0AAU9U3V0_EUPED|nr:unnamed protein product [Euphydryas editha]